MPRNADWLDGAGAGRPPIADLARAWGPRRGAAMRELGVIQDGAVLIRDGVIFSLGPSRRVENLALARQAREIDATGRVVAPGFVDSHTHLVCGPPRLLDYEMRLAGHTYQQIAEAGGGILASVRAVREMPIRRLTLQAQRTLNHCILHGTTTLEAKSGYGLDETGERKALRAVQALNGKPLDLVPTYLGAHAVPPEYAGRPDDYIDWMCSVHAAQDPAAQAGPVRGCPLRTRRVQPGAGPPVSVRRAGPRVPAEDPRAPVLAFRGGPAGRRDGSRQRGPPGLQRR